MYLRTDQGLGQATAPTAPAAQPGTVPAAFPRVTSISFVNTGTSHADNCCAVCPVTLGVGAGGTASNGMELQFTISGHRAGIEYDITRTRRNSLWERRAVGGAGVWTRLESDPMGTNDDHRNVDECLRPRHNRIFAIDRPGWPNSALPIAAGATFGGVQRCGPAHARVPCAVTHADATDVVMRFSFAEWVIARSLAEGIPWTPLELPPLRDGTPRKFVFWHSITWLTRNGAHQWVLDIPHCEIARGPLAASVINSAPTP